MRLAGKIVALAHGALLLSLSFQRGAAGEEGPTNRHTGWCPFLSKIGLNRRKTKLGETCEKAVGKEEGKTKNSPPEP